MLNKNLSDEIRSEHEIDQKKLEPTISLKIELLITVFTNHGRTYRYF